MSQTREEIMTMIETKVNLTLPIKTWRTFNRRLERSDNIYELVVAGDNQEHDLTLLTYQLELIKEERFFVPLQIC